MRRLTPFLGLLPLLTPIPCHAQEAGLFWEGIAAIVSALTMHQIHEKNIKAANNLRAVGLDNNVYGDYYNVNGAAIVSNGTNLNNLPNWATSLNIVFNYNSTYTFPDWGSGLGKGVGTIVGNSDVWGNLGFEVIILPPPSMSKSPILDLLLSLPLVGGFQEIIEYQMVDTLENDGFWHQVYVQLSPDSQGKWLFGGYHSTPNVGAVPFNPYNSELIINGALRGHAIPGVVGFSQIDAFNIGLKLSVVGYPMTWYAGNQVIPKKSGGFGIVHPNNGYYGDLAGLIVQPGYYSSSTSYMINNIFFNNSTNKAVEPTYDVGSGQSGGGMFGFNSPPPPIVLHGNQFPPGFQYNQGVQGGSPTSFTPPNRSFISLGEPYSASDPFP